MGHATTGAHLTEKPDTKPFKRFVVYFSSMRSCGDINGLKFVTRFFSKFAKMPGPIMVKSQAVCNVIFANLV